MGMQQGQFEELEREFKIFLEKNAQIFEKAASVRAAIRMASAEVERISSLKTKVS